MVIQAGFSKLALSDGGNSPERGEGNQKFSWEKFFYLVVGITTFLGDGRGRTGAGNVQIFGCWRDLFPILPVRRILSSGVFLRCTKMLFKEENFVLLFLYVLHCHIHEDKFLHTFCILEIDQFFSCLLLLKISLMLHIDSVR